MKRRIYSELVEYKRTSSTKEALLIAGARCIIGKSYIKRIMNRIKFAFLAIVVAASTFICVSCDKDEDVVNPDPLEISLSSITISLDIDKGSLPEEYVGELSKVAVRQYNGEGAFSDIATLVEKCVVAPMQEKIDEIAEKSGCYDFCVTISAYDVKDSTKIVYTKILKPTKL